METYDIVMLVILIGTAIFGAIKGFAWQLASIASIVVSYLVAYNFREPLSQSIQADPPWNRSLAMLILFIGTSLVIWVAFRMISNTIDRLRLKEFDRQIGALFGLAKGALYCILVTMFGVTLLGDNIREKIVVSRSGHYIASVLDRSDAIIPEEIHQVVGPYLDRFDKKFNLGGNQSPAEGLLPWAQAATDGGLPDSFWDSAPTAASPLPVDRQGWLPQQNYPAQPSSYQQPAYQQQPTSYPQGGYQQPGYQQAERPWGGTYPGPTR